MYMLDLSVSTKGDVQLAVAQSQGKWCGRAPFPASTDLSSKVMSGDVRCGHTWHSAYLTEIHTPPLQSLKLPVWGSRVWWKARDLSTVTSNRQLLPPYSSLLCSPLPSSEAMSVINGNLQRHTSPFWNQIVAIFHGQEKRHTHVCEVLDSNRISLSSWLPCSFTA